MEALLLIPLAYPLFLLSRRIRAQARERRLWMAERLTVLRIAACGSYGLYVNREDVDKPLLGLLLASGAITIDRDCNLNNMAKLTPGTLEMYADD